MHLEFDPAVGEMTLQPDYPGDEGDGGEGGGDPTSQSGYSIFGGNSNIADVARDDAGNRIDGPPDFSNVQGAIGRAASWTQDELSSAYNWAKGEEQKVVDIFNAETKKI